MSVPPRGAARRPYRSVLAALLAAALLWVAAPAHAHAPPAAAGATAAAPLVVPGAKAAGHVTTANLNLRTGPGTTYKVLTVLAKGTKVTTTGKTNGRWWQVTAAGRTGWASSVYLKAVGATKPKPKPAPATTARAVDCRKARCVALTFDDGPGRYTPRLLDTLAKNGARATFFLVGARVGSHPAAVRRIVAEGHQLGNHTWTHRSLPSLSTAAVKSEVQRTDAAIKKVVGFSPRVMRPPYGSHNARVDKAVGKPVVLWSVDTLDWKHRTPSKTVAIALRDVRPGGIILMHDIHSPTVDAIPRLVKELKARGYTMVTLDELFAHKPMKSAQTYVRLN